MDTDRKKRIYFDFLWIIAGLIGILFYFSYPFEIESYYMILYDVAVIFTIIILILGFSLLTIDLIFKRSPYPSNSGLAILFLTFGSPNLILFIIIPNVAIVSFILGIWGVEIGGFHLALYLRKKRIGKTV